MFSSEDTPQIVLISAVIDWFSNDEGDQLSLFEDDRTSEERKALQKVTDELKIRYGKNIVLRGSSLLEESTAKERHNQIGGHHK